METLKEIHKKRGIVMKRIIVVLVSLVLTVIMSIGAVAEENEAYVNIGDYNSDVIALHQMLSDLGYYYLRPESPWNAASENAVKILQENLDLPVTGTVESKDQLDQLMNAADHVIGKNYAKGSSSEWSEWLTPEYNAENRCFTVAYAILDDKSIDDYYTCSVEIEVKDVAVTEGQSFLFVTQGAVDGAWDKGNIWNGSIFYMHDAPDNGVYTYIATNRINEKNVECLKFDLGFRCDYWKSGSFRVRNVKVEKGGKSTEWCPAVE